MVAVLGGGPDQTNMKTNQQRYHSCSFPSNGKRSPPTLKTEQGANLQRQQTGRGPRRCGLGSAHIQISAQGRKEAGICTTVQSREEMKGPILFLCGQGDHMALEARGTWSGSWVYSDCSSGCC